MTSEPIPEERPRMTPENATFLCYFVYLRVTLYFKTSALYPQSSLPSSGRIVAALILDSSGNFLSR